MNIIEKANILSYHRDHLGFPSYLTQGWSTLEKQQLRFDALLRWGDMNRLTLLELGCGYGDFREYLEKKSHDVHYLGIDMCTEFIDEAKRRFQGKERVEFICADFSAVGLPQVDIVVASGSLNYKTGNPSYITAMIQRMWAVAKKGIAFNLLKASHVEPNNIIMGYDEDKIMEFCTTLDASVEFVSDYLNEDITVLMRRG